MIGWRQLTASWFTPTGVGTAIERERDYIVDKVHPHRRGDGGLPQWGVGVLDGSPPQAWGRL